jgi:hypothetical protein
MLFLASAKTLAVFTSIGYSNPNQAWTQALKDDRGTSAPSASEPASEASPGNAPPAGGTRLTPEALPTAEERSIPARVPERISTSTYELVREPTPSPVPCSSSFQWKALRGYGIRASLSAGNALERVEPLAGSRYAGLVWMTTVASRGGGNRPVDFSR